MRLPIIAALLAPLLLSDSLPAQASARPLATTVSPKEARLATGVRLRYTEQGSPQGEPVILLHGYSDTWYSFSRILPLLQPRVRAFAIDQRGHGDSDRPTTGYAMRDLALDVLAFMDATGLDRATLVGHSMGTFVAQQVASIAPARVTRLVLIAGGVDLRSAPAHGELEAAVQALQDPVDAEFVRAFQESTVYHPVPPEFMTRVIDDSRKLSADTWKALMAGMLATGPVAAPFPHPIPVLVLWGDRDAIFPRTAQDGLLATYPGATLTVYDDTGHAVHWERPAESARDILRFIDGR